MKHRFHLHVESFACALTFANVSLVHAQTATPVQEQSQDPARERARTLTAAGAEKYDAGDFAQALDLFSQAQLAYPAPTIEIYVARSQRGLGKYPDAIRTYDHVILSRRPNAEEPEPVRQAFDDALRERDEILQKIGQVDVSVVGPTAFSVLVDGVAIMPRTPQIYLLEPGERTVAIQADGYQSERKTLRIDAGQNLHLDFTLAKDSPPPQVMPAPPMVQQSARPADAPSRRPDDQQFDEQRLQEDRNAARRPYIVTGYIGIGLGAAGLAVGGVATLIANNKKGDLDQMCVDTTCPASAQSTLDSARSTATLATWSTVLGLGLAAGGVSLIIVGHSIRPKSERAPISLAVSPSAIAISRRF